MSINEQSFSDLYSTYPTFDKDSRLRKAKKILAVIREETTASEMKEMSLLDVGCSEGHITSFLSKYVDRTIGVDIDKKAIVKASKNNKRKNLSFQTIEDEILPFKNNSFDIVVANHLYEHATNQEKIFKEIQRVLRPSGFCYVGAPNRLVIIDAHYPTLPFISLLPISLANLYVRVAGKGSSYEPRLKSILGIRNLLKNFKIKDYTIKIIKNPKRYCTEDVVGTLIPHVPITIIKLLYPFISDFIFILKKKRF